MPTCSGTTAKGNPCRSNAVQGSDPPLCNSHLGRAGRKTDLTPDLAEKLVRLLEAGNYLEVSLSAVGLARSTFFEWMGRDDEPFAAFRARVDRARAEAEARHVTLIAKAAAKDWKASAWWLERQCPERWARPTGKPKEGDEDDSENRQPDGERDPFEALPGDELGKRRAARGGAPA